LGLRFMNDSRLPDRYIYVDDFKMSKGKEAEE